MSPNPDQLVNQGSMELLIYIYIYIYIHLYIYIYTYTHTLFICFIELGSGCLGLASTGSGGNLACCGLQAGPRKILMRGSSLKPLPESCGV